MFGEAVPSRRIVSIMGTRGVPASHGGFETLAERLSLYLAERGWEVTVYCQSAEPPTGGGPLVDRWEGVRRVTFGSSRRGPLSTVLFDWESVRHAAGEPGIKLVLGYNTAAFTGLLKLKGHKVVIHTDGIEWVRPKWSLPVKAWFYLNFHCGNLLGDRIVADHPALMEEYANASNRRKMTLISYGGDPVEQGGTEYIASLGIAPDRYFTVIARIEPDNNILTIVRAFSAKPRGYKLAVLGTLDNANEYHRQVREAASPDVVFPGAIYDQRRVKELRVHARAYLHGHFAGGTNPSLVEALWAGNAIIAHRNRFNTWTAGPDQFFFASESECSAAIDKVISDEAAVLRARRAARAWAERTFSWPVHLAAYEKLLDGLY